MDLQSRFFEGQVNRLRQMSTELVRLDPHMIAVIGAIETRAIKDATTTIPVVFAIVPDPVAIGLVTSSDRPGANLTGLRSFDPQQAKQQLGLMKVLIPHLSRIAIFGDRSVPDVLFRENEKAARELGIEPQPIKLEGPNPDLEAAFQAVERERAEALLLLQHPIIAVHLKSISDLTARYKLPCCAPRDYLDAGWTGLMAYGTSLAEAAGRIPVFLDKIRNGANPAEMPIEVIKHSQLVINLQVAKALGITIPAAIRARADRVIN